MASRPIIIDCDPGVDDAVALLLAFAAPEALDILAVTTVAGNVSAALTARNACVIRALAGRPDVPVFAGCTRPMVRAPIEAEHFHGETGLGSLPFDEPAHGPAPEHAVNAIVRLVTDAPAPVTLVVTGPCTNLAMAFLMAPALVDRIDEVVIMGGARSEGGNVTPSAEYNIFADPHAAHVVLTMARAVTVLSLDVTHQIRTTAARTAALARVGGPRALAAVSLLEFSSAATAAYGQGDGAPLHDPATIFWLLAPHLFVARPCRVDVEIAAPLTLGHTAVDFQASGNARWVTHADADAIFAILNERLAP
ncbi:MAG: nucleoside hydrolase [Hyphomonadaceae bacterium]|nr:nucleoside hydrolase [Hyphomonadaceae bacterium]